MRGVKGETCNWVVVKTDDVAMSKFKNVRGSEDSTMM